MIDFPTLVSAIGIIAGIIGPMIKVFVDWVRDLRKTNRTQQDNIDNLTNDLLDEKQARIIADSKANDLERDITNLEQDRDRR